MGGFKLVKHEFQEVWREISLLGYGLIFIAHEKKKATEMRDENGEQIDAVAPDLASAPYSIINSLVDIIGYLSTQMNEDGSTNRYLYTRATPRIFAGSRYKYIAPKISFDDDGYNSLVEAIGNAIDMQMAKDGAQVTDATVLAQPEQINFNVLMQEAKNVWMSLTEKAKAMNNPDESKAFMDKVTGVITEAFGHEIKLSQATPAQQESLEMAVENLKMLLN